jgi:hypothetical protein
MIGFIGIVKLRIAEIAYELASAAMASTSIFNAGAKRLLTWMSELAGKLFL